MGDKKLDIRRQVSVPSMVGGEEEWTTRGQTAHVFGDGTGVG